jgi:hypothetical protein
VVVESTEMKDAKIQVLEQLLAQANLIRRRGSPEAAAAAVPYEQQFAREIEERITELKKQTQPMEKAA